MAIISDLVRLFEELTAQKMMPSGKVYPTLDALIEDVDCGPYNEGFVPVEADEIDEDWPYTDEDYSSNMPCDNSGFCAGSSCPNFFKCQGKT